MNSQEAINALYEGKKVKRSDWNGVYICFDDKKFPIYNEDRPSRKVATDLLFEVNDWEIYEEPIEEYQWLCQDIGSGEFFLSSYVVGNMVYGMGESKYKIIKRLDETRRIRKG